MYSNLVFAILFPVFFQNSFGQAGHPPPFYISGHFNQTLYDATKENNPWGVGIGVQTFFGKNTKWKPSAEITGTFYLEDDKVFRMYSTEGYPIRVDRMINVFGGISFQPGQTIYTALTGGLSFTGGSMHLGIKPAVGAFLSKSHRWLCTLSYINTFNRQPYKNMYSDRWNKKGNFGTISLAVAVQLFANHSK